MRTPSEPTHGAVDPRPILHLRSSTEPSGPDRVLADLTPALAAAGYACTVRELGSRGPLDPELLARLVALGRRTRLIHAHDPKGHVYGLAAARMAGRPLVATHHGWLSRDDRERLYQRLDAGAMRRAARVVCVAEQARAALVRDMGLDPGRVRVVHNGVDVARLERLSAESVRRQLDVPADRWLVVGVGRLESGKGFDVLIDALARLGPVRGRHVHAVVLGEGPARSPLLARARSAGVRDRFSLRGYEPEAASLAGGADLFVMPSRHEGHPVALLEAMALERPSVATRVGAIPETLEPAGAGRVVPPDDAGALADAIAEVLGDPCLAAEMGRAARQEVERRFTSARMAEGYAAVYRELLSPQET